MNLRNESWKLDCASANQIESSNFNWYQVRSKSKINVTEKSNDDEYYNVAVHSLYLSWLFFHELELNLNYNSTTSIEKDIFIHGIWNATRRTHAHFLLNAVNAIRSEHDRELKKCYHDIAWSNDLAISLERVILNHDILIDSSLIELEISLTFFRDLILKFANSLRDILCFLIWTCWEVMTLVLLSSFWQKTKTICFNLSERVVEFYSRLHQRSKHQWRC